MTGRGRTDPMAERERALGLYRGCLLGGAVGDALGAPIEFFNIDEIRRYFGREGLTHYVPAFGGVGRITDDTQMTLFTAEGLLRAWVRGTLKGISSFPGVVSSAYIRWLETQGEKTDQGLEDEPDDEKGWLIQHRKLFDRRAPGLTCLSAIKEMESVGRPARNDSKGCGGVMRVAPVGLFMARRGRDYQGSAFGTGCELSALTHGHPSGILPGGVLAALTFSLVEGKSLRDALREAKAMLVGHRDADETLLALARAEALADSSIDKEEAIERLGQGWVAEEALAIAVYCVLVSDNFRDAVLLSINHSGDSDSTGAITGNLMGAMLGEAAIPPEWLEPLELRDVIAEIAEDLYGYIDWAMGESHVRDRIWPKYPGF